MSNIKKRLYKTFVLGLIKIGPEYISNQLYLKNIHWIRRIKRNKSQDIYIDLSLISLKLLEMHVKSFVKIFKKKTKNKKDTQHIILDFTRTFDISYTFIQSSSEHLVKSKLVTKELYESNMIIILGSNKIKTLFTKYFKYYLYQN